MVVISQAEVCNSCETAPAVVFCHADNARYVGLVRQMRPASLTGVACTACANVVIGQFIRPTKWSANIDGSQSLRYLGSARGNLLVNVWWWWWCRNQ